MPFVELTGPNGIGREHLPGVAVDDIEVTIAAWPNEHLPHLPGERHVEQDLLVDVVIVVLVVRVGLVEPLGRAGIYVA